MKIERASAFADTDMTLGAKAMAARTHLEQDLPEALVACYRQIGGVTITATDLRDHRRPATRDIIEQLYKICRAIGQDRMVVSNLEFLGSNEDQRIDTRAVDALQETMAEACRAVTGTYPRFEMDIDPTRTDMSIVIA